MTPATAARLHERLAEWTIRDLGVWLTAIEVTALVRWRLDRDHATEYPWSYRPMACALRRLARQGLVEERIVRDKVRNRRREYRVMRVSPLFPVAHPLPAAELRKTYRIKG